MLRQKLAKSKKLIILSFLLLLTFIGVSKWQATVNGQRSTITIDLGRGDRSGVTEAVAMKNLSLILKSQPQKNQFIVQWQEPFSGEIWNHRIVYHRLLHTIKQDTHPDPDPFLVFRLLESMRDATLSSGFTGAVYKGVNDYKIHKVAAQGGSLIHLETMYGCISYLVLNGRRE
jgi:hypothetical protein